MTKGIRATSITALVLGAAAFVWILVDLLLLSTDLEKVLFGTWGLPVGIGYLVMLLFHAAAFVLVLLAFSRLEGHTALKVGSLAALVVSLFMIAVQKVMYDEVGRQIKAGFDRVGEIGFVYAGLFVNAACCLVVMVLAIVALRKPSADAAMDRGAPLFTVAQYMGLASGLLGIFLTLSLALTRRSVGRVWFFVPFYLLFLVPYGLTASTWVAERKKDPIGDWYDEKQWRDLTLAALATLVLSVPALAVLLLVPHVAGVYWFLYYLFVVLFLFSGSALFFNSRD